MQADVYVNHKKHVKPNNDSLNSSQAGTGAEVAMCMPCQEREPTWAIHKTLVRYLAELHHHSPSSWWPSPARLGICASIPALQPSVMKLSSLWVGVR